MTTSSHPTPPETLSLDQLCAVTGGGLVWHPGEGFPTGYKKHPPPRSNTSNHPR